MFEAMNFASDVKGVKALSAGRRLSLTFFLVNPEWLVGIVDKHCHMVETRPKIECSGNQCLAIGSRSGLPPAAPASALLSIRQPEQQEVS
jgi:hypothetical protein